MALLSFLFRRKARVDVRSDQERAVTASTIDTASLKAQAEAIVRDIRQNLDHLGEVLDDLEPEPTDV